MDHPCSGCLSWFWLLVCLYMMLGCLVWHWDQHEYNRAVAVLPMVIQMVIHPNAVGCFLIFWMYVNHPYWFGLLLCLFMIRGCLGWYWDKRQEYERNLGDQCLAQWLRSLVFRRPAQGSRVEQPVGYGVQTHCSHAHSGYGNELEPKQKQSYPNKHKHSSRAEAHAEIRRMRNNVHIYEETDRLNAFQGNDGGWYVWRSNRR